MPDPRPDRAHVVILTAGALPGAEPPQPYPTQLAVVSAALTGNDTPGDPELAAAYWRAGWEQAAKEHRVVAVYVLPGEEAAARFAAFMTAEVDPAYARAASCPVDELLRHAENCAGRVIA
jgi:hypothetical protein